jgi:hypothetical protein
MGGYEYRFVRPKFNWLQKEPKRYHEIIEEHGREGWRLVQVLTPGTGPSGLVSFFELIFERELNQVTDVPEGG